MAHITRRELMLAFMAGLLAKHASAQVLPANARIIVGFTPGSGVDLVARRLANELTGKLAGAIIVDNRTGASGNIAVSAALAAAPDGTTLISNPSGVLTVNPHTFRKLGFSPFKDLQPVSLVCRYELGLAVGPAVPESVKTLPDFTAWVRQQRQVVAYGSPATGSGLHFMAHAYSRSQRLNMVHVPYRGAGPMIVDILGGQIAAGAGSLPALMAQATNGRLRVLASTGVGRSRFFPSVPTFEEQGVRGLGMREWHGIYIGGKPDAKVLDHLVTLVQSAVKTPAFAEAIAKQGFEAVASSPQELDQLARADSERWGEIVKTSGFVQES